MSQRTQSDTLSFFPLSLVYSSYLFLSLSLSLSFLSSLLLQLISLSKLTHVTPSEIDFHCQRTSSKYCQVTCYLFEERGEAGDGEDEATATAAAAAAAASVKG